ncbi:carbon-nitrogen hydrolase family protein [bacterium BMS3Abin03]|nr:carbon-nitrogen hydrolase family protein [bacterium BMS3Abin03]
MTKKDKGVIKIATVQAAPVFLNKEKTVEKACKLILQAGKKGAKLVVFPEAFVTAYPDWVWIVPNSKAKMLNDLYSELVQNSLTIPDKLTAKLCNAARQAKINVAIGVNEKNTESSDASLFNTLLFIDDKGKITGKHRKLIPTGGERLVWAYGDGNTLNVFNSSIGKIGALICWENLMPLARQAMYYGGAQILVSPTWDKSEKWLQSIRHIAREGGIFVISSCMAIRMKDIPDHYEFKKLYPEGREWINTGNSCIVNPNGDIIAGPVEKKEEILYAEINLNDIIKAKRMFDAAGHYSRPDVFSFKVNKNS